MTPDHLNVGCALSFSSKEQTKHEGKIKGNLQWQNLKALSEPDDQG